MSTVSEGVLIVAALLRQEILRKRRKKRCWIKKWIGRREVCEGRENNLCVELLTENEDDFKNMFRVNRNQFYYLLDKVGSSIQRQNTTMRNAIPARTKLEIALKYLATGDSLGTLSQLFRVPKCTLLVEVLEAIYSTLEDFIKVPRSEEEWNKIRRVFFIRWNFPNCIGAIDGKHINLKCPPGTGSDFFNYKSLFSIVLLACVNHDYCFTYIDVGAKGRNSDGGIFNNCTLKTPSLIIEENTVHLPSNSVLVGDEAFSLKPYLMKPYPRRNDLTREQKIYNYRLCRCRRIVENAFGILTLRFRVFEKPITTSIDKVDVMVKTSCAIHNWLRKTSPASYTPPGFIDEECPRSDLRLGTWRQNASGGAFGNITSQNNRNSTRTAIRIRDDYCSYFNNDGAVPWLNNAIF